jgi:nitrogen fixation protein FixH
MTRELKGGHVLAIVLTFFSITIGVNVYFIAAAVFSHTGEDQKKSYLQGLHYNDTLAARAAQREMGWIAEFAIRRAPGAATIIQVNIKDAKSRGVGRLHLTGRLKRPVQASMDRILSFVDDGGGTYRATVATLAHGRWRLDLDASMDSGAAPIFHSEKFVWLQ